MMVMLDFKIIVAYSRTVCINSLKVGSYNWRNCFSVGFWECNKIFMVFVEIDRIRDGWISITRGNKSCRVNCGVGFVKLGVVGLPGNGILCFLRLSTWRKDYHGQVFLYHKTFYMTNTIMLCTLFSLFKCFPSGFCWARFSNETD